MTKKEAFAKYYAEHGDALRAKARARAAARRAADPDAVRAYKRTRYHATKVLKGRPKTLLTADDTREYKRKKAAAYRARDPEAARAALQAWREANPEKVKAASRRTYQRNRSKLIAKAKVEHAVRSQDPAYRKAKSIAARKWAVEHPIERAIQNENRRALKAGGKVTAREWREQLAVFGHRCGYCGTKGRLTQDHVIALTRGGPHTIDNLVPACRSCNSSKQARGPLAMVNRPFRVTT